MESRPSYTVVGLFVLLLSAGAVFFALWMGQFSERKKQQREYYTYMFESVSGLPKDGSVKYMGVEIGKVSDIHIDSADPTHVRLTLRLPADFVVREGMYTQLKLAGVTGIAYVEISGGRAGAKPISVEKGKVPVIPSRPSALSKLGDALPEVAVNMADSFKHLNAVLTDETIDHLNRIAAHLDESTAHLTEVLSRRNVENLQTLLQNLADASRQLEKLYETSDAVKEAARQIGEESNATLRSVKESADAFAQMSRDLDRRIARGEFDLRTTLEPTVMEARRLMQNTRSLIYELEEEISQLRQSPRDLFFKESEPLPGPGETASTKERER